MDVMVSEQEIELETGSQTLFTRSQMDEKKH